MPPQGPGYYERIDGDLVFRTFTAAAGIAAGANDVPDDGEMLVWSAQKQAYVPRAQPDYSGIFELTAHAHNRLDSSSWLLSKPSAMSTLPTLSSGVANAASSIASSVLVPSYQPGAFSYIGGPKVQRGTTYPNYTGVFGGSYPQATSASPFQVEFMVDTADATGRFEISSKGNGLGFRVCVLNASGRWEYTVASGNSFSHPADGSGYFDLVTLGAAGRYSIRIEFQGNQTFFGIRVGPTDTVVARNARSRRYFIMGDSFTEPTVVDSGASSAGSDGWVQVLAHMTGLDIASAGSGGTGYLQTNGARPKFRDRLVNDVLAQNPDGIIWAGGINDFSQSAAAVQAEALACYQLAAGAIAGLDQVVLSPFYPRALHNSFVSNAYALRDGIKTSALAAGVRFLDLLALPTPDYIASWNGSTLQASASAGATSISVASIPSYFATQIGVGGLDGWYVQIGTDASAEVRGVTNVNGTGPYTLSVPALSNAHASGQAVALTGPSYMTGQGRQGTPTGTGNADRYTGSDTTHPTVAGHAYIAQVVAHLWARSLRLNP